MKKIFIYIFLFLSLSSNGFSKETTFKKELFDVQYQTTLLIFKDKKLVYRSIGETTKDLIYKAIKSSI